MISLTTPSAKPANFLIASVDALATCSLLQEENALMRKPRTMFNKHDKFLQVFSLYPLPWGKGGIKLLCSNSDNN